MMKAPAADAPLADRPMQILGGSISLLIKTEGRLNLLAGVQQKAEIAGAVLALCSQAGAATNAMSENLASEFTDAVVRARTKPVSAAASAQHGQLSQGDQQLFPQDKP